MTAYLSAKVKAVLSADTLILVPANHTGPTAPVERQLSLAYIQAPRLSLNEIYSFQARELLRNLLVNKVIKFKVLYTLPGLGGSKREFGDIKTPIFDSLIGFLLEKGAARVKDTSDPADEDYYHDLKGLEESAKVNGQGLWVHSHGITVVDELLFDEVEGSKKKPIDSIVEKVISGDRVLVRFLLSKQKHAILPVLIAGVRAPRSGGEDPEPFGNEAKYFVEQRLLLRNVGVSVLGESSNGVTVGKLIHLAGNISEKLLENGYGTVVDWQSTIIGAKEMSLLRASERLAKVGLKGIWKSLTKTAVTSLAGRKTIYSGATFNATVAKVISVDTVFLRTKDDEEFTAQLSSLRGPRASSGQSAFVPLAKEFLRKKIIGKTVKVLVDGIRPKSEQFEERPVVTIYLGEANLSLQIVRAGWATVVRHRKDDEDRSADWDLLIEEEAKATEKKAGIHGKLPPAERIVDASETAGRAKTFLPNFINRGKIAAVVDYVSSPNRFRLILPKDGAKIVLVLGGLTNKNAKDSALSQAALNYVTKKALQRDVTIEIYSVDRLGSFIGNLFLPGQNLPLQVGLLNQGFVELHESSVDATRFGDQLWDAQEEAQKNRIGVWRDYKEDNEDNDVIAQTASLSISKNYYDIEVNDINEEGLLSFQILNSESERLISFMKEFHEFHQNQPVKASNDAAYSYPRLLIGNAKKGDLVSAAYSRNGKFYRAKIISFDKATKKYTVQHIDFGNYDTVSSTSFRELPPRFSIAKLPAQGHVGEFTHIKLPPSKPTNYLDDAIDFLDELIINKKIIALENKAFPEAGVRMAFTLYDPEKVVNDPSYSINKELVENGWAIVNKSLKPWQQPLIKEQKELLVLEKIAKAKRIGCWELGDIEEDDF